MDHSDEGLITNLEDYIRLIRDFKPGDEYFPLWFRGESKIGRGLTPTLLRGPYKEGPLMFERNLFALFSEHATAYISSPPKAWIDWQITMQHHSCPTRLLDWTESALIALYFAVKRMGKDGDAVDGTVYILDPHALSSCQAYPILQPGSILTAAELRGDKADDLIRSGIFQIPVPFFPSYIAPRALAQKSRFTLYPFESVDLPSPILRHVTIPAGAKRGLFLQLKLAGVTATTLFPDLDGLAREMRATVTGGDDSGW